MAETDSAKAEEIENFYGVYLLVSQNVRYKGRTYVGFTVDPIRRLKQHNGGRSAIIQRCFFGMGVPPYEDKPPC